MTEVDIPKLWRELGPDWMDERSLRATARMYELGRSSKHKEHSSEIWNPNVTDVISETHDYDDNSDIHDPGSVSFDYFGHR
jgi:hypothetical protein